MEIKDNVTREIAFNIRIEKSQFGCPGRLSLLAFTPQTSFGLKQTAPSLAQHRPTIKQWMSNHAYYKTGNSLNYKGWEKHVTKIKSVKIKRVYIDVKVVEILYVITNIDLRREHWFPFFVL